jgi:hypothetical protein
MYITPQKDDFKKKVCGENYLEKKWGEKILGKVLTEKWGRKNVWGKNGEVN